MDSKAEYISDTWNMMDVTAILFYLIGFITRFFVLESVFAVSKYDYFYNWISENVFKIFYFAYISV